MTHSKFDIQRIKEQTSIRDLAESHGPLRRESSKELSGACPKCGGKDRFHCQIEWFMCRSCHPKRGDAIEYMMWFHEVDFTQACEMLGGVYGHTPPVNHKKEVRTDQSDAVPRWKTDFWQQDANLQMEIAAKCLNSAEGETGSQYVLSRLLQPETAKAWKLGFVPNLKRRRKVDGIWLGEDFGPAISIPWTNGKLIKALQYRLMNNPNLRYWQKAGGDRTIFGVHLLAWRPVLVICEGELNAVSFWQVAHEHVDVVSYGPQDNVRHASSYLKDLACRYENILVWADEPAKAVEAVDIIGVNATPAMSPRGMDANDLLCKGVLTDVLANVLENAFSFAAMKEAQASDHLRIVYSPDEHVATVHGKWRRLEDGSIEATYTRSELLWAMMPTGYEPTPDELIMMASSK